MIPLKLIALTLGGLAVAYLEYRILCAWYARAGMQQLENYANEEQHSE